jgi:hypothetical protein
LMRSLFTACLILIAGFAVVAPPAAADPTTWANESLAAFTGGVQVTAMRSDNDGEKVGITYLTTSGGNALHFLLKPNETAAWTNPNNDITGADVPNGNYQLSHMGGQKWAIFAFITGSLTKFYYTINDGTTWAAGASQNCGTCLNTVFALEPWVYTDSALVIQGVASGGLGGQTQLDYTTGAFPTSSYTLSDNEGGFSSPTQTIPIAGADLIVKDSNPDKYQVWMRGTDGSTYWIASDDFAFWDIPYTTSGGSTKAPLVMTDCPGTGATAAPQAWISATETQAFFLTKNGANNYYACSYVSPNVAGSYTGSYYPSQAPAIAARNAVTNARMVDSNGAGQSVAAVRINNVDLQVIYQSEIDGAWSNVFTATNANTEEFLIEATPTTAYLLYTDNADGGRLEVSTADISVPLATNDPIVSRTLTAERIKGGDTDPDGGSMILRTQTATEQRIRSLDTATLADRQTPYGLGCNANGGTGTEREQGIFAYHDREEGHDYVSFIDCTDTGDRDKGNTWRIRNGALGAPIFSDGGVCASDDFCDTNIQSAGATCDNHIGAGGNDLPDQAQQITDVQSIPISYSRDGTSGQNHATVGFAFNDLATGEIGVWAQTDNHFAPNRECAAKIPFSTPGQTYQICTWSNAGDGNDYLAAVSATANTKTARVTVDVQDVGTVTNFGEFEPDVNLASIPAPGAPWNRAAAIGCGADTDAVILASNGHVNRVSMVGDTGVGETRWSSDYVISGSPQQRGVAFANSGYGAAVYDSGVIKVFNEVGVMNGTLTLPTHTQFIGMDLDDTAQYLYVYLNNGVDGLVLIYETIPFTTGASVPPGTRPGEGCLNNENQIIPCTGEETPPAVDPNDPNALSDGLIPVTRQAAVFGSIAMVMGFALLAYAFTRKRERREE